MRCVGSYVSDPLPLLWYFTSVTFPKMDFPILRKETGKSQLRDILRNT